MSLKRYSQTDLERVARLVVQFFGSADAETVIADAVQQVADTTEPVYTLEQIERALAAALRALNP